MGYTTRLSWETLRVIDSATLNGTYQALGDALEQSSYICKVVNNSTVLVTISIDGINDVDVVPAGSFWLYDCDKTTEHESIPVNTQFYVKGSAGTGSIYLVNQFLIKS